MKLLSKAAGMINRQNAEMKRMKRQACMYDRWLGLKIEGKSVESYFVENQIRTIAVYGMGKLGRHFCNDLRGSGNVKIKYGMDRNYVARRFGIPLRKLTDEILPVEAVVVTPIADMESIRKELGKKFDCPVVALEEVIYSV